MKKIFTVITACQILPLLFACCLAAASTANPVLRNLNHTTLSPETEKVTMQLNGAHSPTIFTLKGDTPRIVFDFPGMIQARTVANSTQVDGKMVQRIRVGMHTGDEPKTRVVLDVASLDGVTFTPHLDEQAQVLTVLITASTATPELKAEGKKTAVTTQPAPPIHETPSPETTPTFEPLPAPAERPIEVATAPALTPETTQPRLLNISFDPTAAQGEMVLFKLNGFFPPSVRGVEEGNPRVICDFDAVELADTVGNTIEADGRYVKNIRVGKHTNPERVRVVLDLEPNKSYDLQQVFFREDNLFVMIVNTLEDGQPFNAPVQ
ncbi:AMIN domain-containing protein [Desulfobulbus alkaliphilus]|uniref:AMIN domain-containing protein n=1 Tax=Desulfobulbus alkaliphilus TaxID=869814 RepID=UPI0019630321|nr:AMIN domain-containing protein [Desulfobulbus alkaliphilus]MBM9536424.1 AMIN domain-containing protein [Desulfobulbus alkaliphilus]